MSPLTDNLSLLRSLYPQARVTSGYRSPSSPLGQANPRSYHNIGQAFDVAPIPGVKFGDYVNNLKSNGVNVVEALDEASRPAFDTTGPNWHIAFGASPKMAPYYAPKRAPATLADLGASQYPVSNGVDPLAPNPDQPVSLNAQPMAQAPATLADLQGTGVPVKAPSKLTAGNILGVLGDALSAYGGRAPTFGPFLQQQAMMDKQQSFDREKFNAELQMRMYAMLHPEKFMEANAFANADPATRQNFVDYENVTNPQVADTQLPNGSFVRNIIPRTVPPKVGEVRQGYQFLGGDPAQQTNWKAVQ